MPKTRLDVLLVERGFVSSREKAKALIMAGDVFINGQREDKPGTSFQEDKIKNIEVRGATIPFVSRGGLKLDKAVKTFNLDFTGFTCMDIGASTGGFTDCMLQNGAVKVYSVDVGHGQLDWKLRSDDRVVCMEKTNFRYLTRDQIDDDIDFASCDVSFISLTRILVPARKLLKDGAQMVVLIKPQFEAGRDKVGKKGVVRDKKVHEEVISRIMDFADMAGFEILHLDYSPIRGPEGNIEYLLHLKKDASRNEEVSEYDEATALKKFGEIEDSCSGISKTQANMTLIGNAVDAAHGELEG
ncbi:MAG: TlyA family RNA methyltransferase [Butyrivibrio sp.]|uniref:TlyA family RNA methyltransferase n=1 Tax=Butyrivibrio sp. TaxID=28121 RepID=UPI0025FB7C7E|nr:TlyA family RNA methyltransferase [Butyrivibrio sp.]MCR5773432.1 TlyA family RNA methyltransferase [Butyrivibrio sp.]